jgi:hypothetical protein
MKKVIAIENIGDVYNFVAECAKLKCAYDVYAERGRISIPCNSLMGIISMNPSEPFDIIIPDTEETKNFVNYISKFEV